MLWCPLRVVAVSSASRGGVLCESWRCPLRVVAVSSVSRGGVLCESWRCRALMGMLGGIHSDELGR